MIVVDLQGDRLQSIWNDDPCALLFELAARHPGEPALLRNGQDEMVLFQDAEAARHITRTRPDNYRKHFGTFAELFGTSRLTTDGARWQRLQRLSQPSINAADPGKVVEAVRRHFGAAIRAMLEEAPLGPVFIDPHLDRAAASVLADTVLGFGPDDITPTLIADFHTILRYASLRIWSTSGELPGAAARLATDAAAAKARLRDGVEALLTRHGGTETAGNGLLGALLEAGEDADQFSEICTLMFAGADTTATALGWAMRLLAGSPALQQRLRGGISELASDGELSPEALAGLNDVTAFQNEALRIFPPVPMLSRISVEGDQVGAVAVPGGQRVLVSVIGLHHDPRFFPGSRRVSLARFPGGMVPRELAGQFLPFSAGRRVCGGSRFATLELTAALALLISRLQMSAVESGPLSFDWLVSLRRRGGHHIVLAPS